LLDRQSHDFNIGNLQPLHRFTSRTILGPRGSGIQFYYAALLMTPRLVHVRLALNQGKIGTDAIRPPTVEELKSFAGILRDELDAFVGEQTEMRHRVDVLFDRGSGLAVVEMVGGATGRLPVRVMRATDEAARGFAAARTQLIEKHAQWLYFRRNLRVCEPSSKTYILKPLQRLQWTQTQAMQDAGDIIAESIQPNPTESERVVG
ncbi:MAG TPA: hypothetical protein VKM93_05255, partial [Terriglobia bacterium]|nr:hypothetical protein [Terriglobia bacterium]